MSRRVLIIINPAAAAGRSRQRWLRFRDRVECAVPGAERVFSRGPGHAAEMAREAASGFDTVVAAGGDGTVREVASGLLRAGVGGVRLAVLPLGTGNDFATQAGVGGVEGGVDALRSGEERWVDAIEVRWWECGGERVDHALLFAATGFAAAMGRTTSPRVKRWFGRRGAYPVGFLLAFAGFQVAAGRVRADGREFRGRFLHVCAGNTARAGGGVMHLSPGARLDDGRLEFCLVDGAGRRELLRAFPKLVRGSFPGHPKVCYFGGQKLVVETSPAGELCLDGDVLGRTPAEFTVLPGALRLLVPVPVSGGGPAA